MNVKSISCLGALFFAFVLMANACTPAIAPALTATPILASATPVPASATPIPTSTPALTATPAFALQCNLVKVKLQQGHPVNVYTLTGEVVGAGAEAEGLQVNIIGEYNQPSSRGTTSTDADYHGNLTVKFDEEWTYASSQHTYKVAGRIVYKLPDLQTLTDYTFTVTGGGFDSTPRTCGKP